MPSDSVSRKPIDLRSDTVTRPTPAMRRAMAEAEVGDDVYGEDPTLNRLEQRAAGIMGKEAAVFVPSGTMGNNVAIKIHTSHGQEVICEARSHIMDWELAMMAWFSGCLARPVASVDGVLSWADIKPRIRLVTPHNSRTGLICLENTHNMGGGAVQPPEAVEEICDRAHEMGLPVHIDGARIFNAAAALGRPVRELVAKADTVMFCLSKGLGAPVGSMVAGTAEAIERGRAYRKRLGGAMRQAGVLAAAGLVALEQMPGRLGEDHANARRLAEGIEQIPGLRLLYRVQTNIVIFDTVESGMAPPEFVARLKERGVLAGAVYGTAVRLLTHFDVTREDCETALGAMAEVAALTPALR